MPVITLKQNAKPMSRLATRLHLVTPGRYENLCTVRLSYRGSSRFYYFHILRERRSDIMLQEFRSLLLMLQLSPVRSPRCNLVLVALQTAGETVILFASTKYHDAVSRPVRYFGLS